MPDINNLITDNLEIWSNTIKKKKAVGRGSSKKVELYGVKKLRELILDLAVRGLLVDQNSNDQPAKQLTKAISIRKSALLEQGKIKKPKVIQGITDDEKLFSLPDGWEWQHCQNICEYIQRGKGPKYAESGRVKVISQKCIQWLGFDESASRYVDNSTLDKYQPERYLRKNDLVWNSTGTGTVGRINTINEIETNTYVADSHVTVVRPLLVNTNFLCSYISSPAVQNRIDPAHENSLVSGTTKQVELNTSSVQSLAIPIPPLEEQKRIVAKVDELMALCDQLEKQQENSISAHQTLVKTLLDALVDSASHSQTTEGKTKFEQAWERIAEHFDTLFTTEDSIDQLKQTILQLAVMGKLVPQNQNDEPAAALLESIHATKSKLIKAKLLKKRKQVPEFNRNELPFQLPKGWEWARLQNTCIKITDGSHNPPSDSGSGYPMLSSQNINHNKIDFSSPSRYLSEEDFRKEDKRTSIEPNDILLNIVASIGRSAVVPKDAPKFALQRSVAVLSTQLDPHYFARLLVTPLCLEYYDKHAKGTAQKGIYLGKLSLMPLTVPPLKEQKRIVTKVNELMKTCDQLKSNIALAQSTQIKLSDSIARQALS